MEVRDAGAIFHHQGFSQGSLELGQEGGKRILPLRHDGEFGQSSIGGIGVDEHAIQVLHEAFSLYVRLVAVLLVINGNKLLSVWFHSSKDILETVSLVANRLAIGGQLITGFKRPGAVIGAFA